MARGAAHFDVLRSSPLDLGHGRGRGSPSSRSTSQSEPPSRGRGRGRRCGRDAGGRDRRVRPEDLSGLLGGGTLRLADVDRGSRSPATPGQWKTRQLGCRQRRRAWSAAFNGGRDCSDWGRTRGGLLGFAVQGKLSSPARTSCVDYGRALFARPWRRARRAPRRVRSRRGPPPQAAGGDRRGQAIRGRDRRAVGGRERAGRLGLDLGPATCESMTTSRPIEQELRRPANAIPPAVGRPALAPSTTTPRRSTRRAPRCSPQWPEGASPDLTRCSFYEPLGLC